MAERIDLDAVMADYEAARQAAWRGNVSRVIGLAERVRDLIAELRVARAVVSSAGVASITVERLVNTLAKDHATWDDDAVAMWDAVQVLQRDLSLYRKATT